MELAEYSVAQVFSYRHDDLPDICPRACFTMLVPSFDVKGQSDQERPDKGVNYLTLKFEAWAGVSAG